MPKLTDTQTILLSHAAQAANGSFSPAPDKLSSATGKVANVLERLKTIGLAEERETSDVSAIYREDGDLRFGLFITAAGLAAIGVEPAAGEGTASAPASAAAPDASENPASPARPTKAAAVLTLLQRDQGATLPELIEATGWLPHTTRAALTGLRKKGHALDKSKRDDVTCYTIKAAS